MRDERMNEPLFRAEVEKLLAEGVLVDEAPYCQVCGARVTRLQASPRQGGVLCSPTRWQEQ